VDDRVNGYTIRNWSGAGDALTGDANLVFGPFRRPHAISGGTGRWGILETFQARRVLTATGSLNFPSIPAGSTAELTLSVKGAEIGDTVLASPNTTVEAGLVWCAYVSAADTVTLRVANVTGAAIDPAARTWRVSVYQFNTSNLS